MTGSLLDKSSSMQIGQVSPSSISLCSRAGRPSYVGAEFGAGRDDSGLFLHKPVAVEAAVVVASVGNN